MAEPEAPLRRDTNMRWILILVFGLSLTFGAVAAAQRRSPAPPAALTIDSLTGKDTFDAYCATCHGRGGAGNGPLTPVLRTMPADLRLLAAKRGFFPRDQIVAFVTGSGRPIAAHGTSDMPIWGSIFRSLDPSDARVKIRIKNVVDYVESLQQP
jgi:mono/diheme cytochrome c family protein